MINRNANHKKKSEQNDFITVISSKKDWRIIDIKEVIQYRDLFLFFIWRNIKVLYAQTIMGLSWAIIQPLLQILIFTIVFGKVAKVDTDGIPYFLFSTVAIIPWNYISISMTQSSQSLVEGQRMLGKIYFPRIAFPITPIFARLVDFGISTIIILSVLLYYKVSPTLNLLLLPLFFLVMMIIPAGIGMWLAALAIRFRDVKLIMPFIIKMLVYTAPIVYSATSIPAKYRFVYSLNPLVSVIEGYRSCLLGTPMPWDYVIPGIFTAILLFVFGALYFRRMENIFVDVI